MGDEESEEILKQITDAMQIEERRGLVKRVEELAPVVMKTGSEGVNIAFGNALAFANYYEGSYRALCKGLKKSKSSTSFEIAARVMLFICANSGTERITQFPEFEVEKDKYSFTTLTNPYSAGIKWVKKAIELDPSNKEAWKLYRSFLAIFRNRGICPQEEIREVAKRLPRDLDTILIAARDLPFEDDGKKYFRRALHYMQKNPKESYLQTLIEIAVTNHQDAAEQQIFDLWKMMDPSPKPLVQRAMLHYYGNPEIAVQMYEEALKIDPNEITAKSNLEGARERLLRRDPNYLLIK